MDRIISFFDFPDFGFVCSFLPVSAFPAAAVLPAVLPAGAVPSQWNLSIYLPKTFTVPTTGKKSGKRKKAEFPA